MSSKKRAVHAYLSEDAHGTWHQVAFNWGVSVSALLEALAPMLAEHSDEAPVHASSSSVALVDNARRIDAERRRRSVA